MAAQRDGRARPRAMSAARAVEQSGCAAGHRPAKRQPGGGFDRARRVAASARTRLAAADSAPATLPSAPPTSAPRCTDARGACEKAAARCLFDDLAQVHHRDVVADVLDHGHVVRNEQERLARVRAGSARSRFRICARIAMSSADTGSSHTIRSGLRWPAPAPRSMRCRWPPENWCGNSWLLFGPQAHQLKHLGDARLAPAQAGRCASGPAAPARCRRRAARGFSDEIRVLEHQSACRRRVCRSADPPRARQVRAVEMDASPTCGSASRSTDNAVVVLPEPDSPTIASVLARAARSNDTPSTALHHHRLAVAARPCLRGKCTARFLDRQQCGTCSWLSCGLLIGPTGHGLATRPRAPAAWDSLRAARKRLGCNGPDSGQPRTPRSAITDGTAPAISGRSWRMSSGRACQLGQTVDAAPACRDGAGARQHLPRRRPAPPRAPPYITTTRSAISATAPMSCVISSTRRAASRACSSRSRSKICACTVTSSAVVGSSAISTSGSQASAMAIITRWRMPPESWCG